MVVVHPPSLPFLLSARNYVATHVASIKPRISATMYMQRAGRVYVRVPNVCCSAFGYTGAPFSVAGLLINPETLIASRARARTRECEGRSRAYSLSVCIPHVCTTVRNTRSRERCVSNTCASLCIHLTLSRE